MQPLRHCYCLQVSVQLQSGQEAANGFRTLFSNRLTVNIDMQPPQVGAAALHL